MTIKPDEYFGDEWVVLGKEDCPWCERVRQKLEKEEINYKYYDLGHYPELRNWCIEFGMKTVPQVFHLGLLIGGYELTTKYLEAPRSVDTIGN